MLSVTFSYYYAVCHTNQCGYAQCHNAQCHYARSHYAQCRGANKTFLSFDIAFQLQDSNLTKFSATFILTLTEVWRLSSKDFLNLDFWSRPNFVSFNLVHEQKVLLFTDITVT